MTPTTIEGASQRGTGRGPLAAWPLDTLLAIHAELGPRNRFEAGDNDATTRGDADAVGAVVHPLQCPIDLVHRLAGIRGEHQVTFALDRDGVALARLLVELGVTLLPLVHEQVRVG